jgi:hypothetical protein
MLDQDLKAYCSVGKFIEQHLQECEGKPASSRHVVVVAHGIFNSEFLGALLARRPTVAPLEWSYRGELAALGDGGKTMSLTMAGMTNVRLGRRRSCCVLNADCADWLDEIRGWICCKSRSRTAVGSFS